MKTFTRQSVYVLVCVSLIATSSFAQSDSAATSRGTAIGETISAAINAAVPGATTAANLIISLLKGKSEEKVSQQQLKTKLEEEAEKLRQKSQQELRNLSAAIDEVAATNQLAKSARKSYESLIVAKAFVALGNEAGWGAFDREWAGVTKIGLTEVLNFDPAKLGKISNQNVQVAWERLKAQYERLLSEVKQFSERREVALMVVSLNNLQDITTELATIPSVQLDAFARQLRRLAVGGFDVTVAEEPSLLESFFRGIGTG